MAIHLKRNERLVPHTELSIQKLLVRRFRNGMKYVVLNMYNYLGEMDVFMLRRSGYAEEFEIKISTSDFKADKKKIRKHRILQQSDPYRNRNLFVPNKFSYVLGPDVECNPDDIPDKYGIYIVDEHGLHCHRAAEFLHKNKLNWNERVAKSCSWRLLVEKLRSK